MEDQDIVPAGDTDTRRKCPCCQGRGQTPRVRHADGETVGYHPWPCYICHGEGTVPQ